jgi:hypothetical protein
MRGVHLFWCDSRQGRRYAKPAKPSQCVEVLVNPRSKPASITRFFRTEYDVLQRFPTA